MLQLFNPHILIIFSHFSGMTKNTITDAITFIESNPLPLVRFANMSGMHGVKY